MQPIHINKHVYIAFASQSYCHVGYRPCSAVDMDRLVFLGLAVSLFSAEVDDGKGGLDCPRVF